MLEKSDYPSNIIEIIASRPVNLLFPCTQLVTYKDIQRNDDTQTSMMLKRWDTMKRLFSTIIITIITATLAGCFGAAPIKPAANPYHSAAYGNITLPDNMVITRVILHKVGEVYAPPFKSPPQSHTYTNGNFFFENLEPGKYYLVSFMSGNNAFYFNYRGLKDEEFLSEVAIDIKPGSAVYLGSYKVTGIERNFLKSDTFEIKPSKQPAKGAILEHLKQAAKGTGWDKRFANAMKGK